MKILTIDDDQDTREIIKLTLGCIDDCTVFEAAGGLTGVDIAKREQVDIILLDLIMPDFDGRQTFELLKSNNQTSTIPVIFITTKGYFEGFDELKSKSSAYVDVILKPFDPMSLINEIQRVSNQIKI